MNFIYVSTIWACSISFYIFIANGEKFAFPLFIPRVDKNLPIILFINEGEFIGTANISMNTVSETVIVDSPIVYDLSDTLLTFDIVNENLIIFIETYGEIHPYLSVKESAHLFALQPLSKAVTEYYLYDVRGYNLNSYCLDIMSTDNNAQIKLKKNLTNTHHFTLEKFETRRICALTEILKIHLESSQRVVVMMSGDVMSGTPLIIDMLVGYAYFGKTFIVYPLLHSQNYTTFVRILSVKNQSAVYNNQNNSEIIIGPGNYREIEITDPLSLVANNPVFVTLSSFHKSNFYNTKHEKIRNDSILDLPVMPFEQYISRTYIRFKQISDTSKAIITTKCRRVPHITFDEDALADKNDTVVRVISGQTDYCLIEVPITAEKKHEIRSHLPNSGFTLMIDVTGVNTSFAYNGHFNKLLNCKTLIYGNDIYEHDCDVRVVEKNASCSAPQNCTNPTSENCGLCVQLGGVIALGIGSAVATIVVNMFFQVLYCPWRSRKKDIKFTLKKIRETQEKKERQERERLRNEQIIKDRREKLTKDIEKPTDSTKFYQFIGDLGKVD